MSWRVEHELTDMRNLILAEVKDHRLPLTLIESMVVLNDDTKDEGVYIFKFTVDKRLESGQILTISELFNTLGDDDGGKGTWLIDFGGLWVFRPFYS